MTLLPAFVRDCRTATRLIERRADGIISPPERLRLWAHLHLCVYCRRYEAQSRLVAQLAPRLAPAPTPLAEVVKAQWRARIVEAMG